MPTASQGDIYWVDVNPVKGHEQAGASRPVLVVSADSFNHAVGLAIVCTISSSTRPLPFHVALDSSTQTYGYIQCEQIRVLDLQARGARFAEKVPADILKHVLHIIKLELDIR